jgi:hypothetical protein
MCTCAACACAALRATDTAGKDEVELLARDHTVAVLVENPHHTFYEMLLPHGGGAVCVCVMCVCVCVCVCVCHRGKVMCVII